METYIILFHKACDGKMFGGLSVCYYLCSELIIKSNNKLTNYGKEQDYSEGVQLDHSR